MRNYLFILALIFFISCDDENSNPVNRSDKEEIADSTASDDKENLDSNITSKLIYISNLEEVFGEWQVDRYYIEYDGEPDTAKIENFSWQKLKFYSYEYCNIDFGEGYKKQIFHDAGYGIFLGTYVFNKIKLYSDNSMIISGTFSNDPELIVKDSLFLSKIKI